MRKIYFLLILPFFSLFSSEGIEYTYLEFPDHSFFSWITEPPPIHIIEVDPNLYEIKPVKALDDGLGRESVFSISERHGAIASVNGGFFSIGGTFDGKASGALKIHDWFALPVKARGCIGWSSTDQVPKMDRILVKLELNNQINTCVVDGLNRPRKEGEILLYTPCFHKTTLTNPDGQEVIVVDDIVQSINQGGSTKIPENGYVLSIQNTHPLFNTFSIGDVLTITSMIEPILNPSLNWDFFEYIVGGTPLLFHETIKEIDFRDEQTIFTFLSNRHARTAVGLLPNGHWLFVVVDKTSHFDGMTIYELTDLLTHLGCTCALNLDGGGSSTMVFQGEIKNSPQGDEDEDFGKKVVRRVSDAIIVCPKN